MSLAQPFPCGVAALGVPSTHEGSTLQAQAGLLGPLPTLPPTTASTLSLSHMQKQCLRCEGLTRYQPEKESVSKPTWVG